MRHAAAQIFLVGNDPELPAVLSELLRADDIAIRSVPSGDGIFEFLQQGHVGGSQEDQIGRVVTQQLENPVAGWHLPDGNIIRPQQFG